jgi:putative glutamine amidotransferase
MKPRIAITADAQRLDEPKYLLAYKSAIEKAGAEPVLLSSLRESGDAAEALARVDGLLLPGGSDLHPDEYGGRDHPSLSVGSVEYDRLELAAARAALHHDIPTLAICRGVQVMNVALGGTLWEDIPDQYQPPNGLILPHRQTPPHPRSEATHPVDLKHDSLISRIIGSAMAPTNSMHHQALRRIAHDLVVVGTARDGIVEAVEARTNHPFYLGVQWHPEEMVEVDAPSRALFSAFVETAKKRADVRASAV